MSHEYQLRLYDTTGTLVAIFDDWNSVYYFNRISDYGYHTISIDGDDPRAALFVPDSIVQVLRRDTGENIDWYSEYEAFHRTGVYSMSDRGRSLFSSYGRGFEDLLNRRAILYRPGDIDVNAGIEGEYSGTSQPADDVMKRWVTINAGNLSAITNGRLADGQTTGLTVAANLSAAPTWEGRRSFKNLLDVLKEIREAMSVDFRVVWSGSGQNFTFNTYYPRRGTDRTGAGAAAPVIFSLENANMSEPYSTTSRMEEVTAVYVAGQGQGTDRTVVERLNSSEISISPWNRIEVVHDARNESTTAALQTIGDGHLLEHNVDKHLSFQILQSPGTVYGRDYFIGDLVLGYFNGVSESRSISGVEVTVAEGKEDIRIHVGDL